MELLWFFGIVFILAVIWNVKKEAKQKRNAGIAVEDYNQAIESQRQKMLNGDSEASIPVLDANEEGYRRVAKESLLAIQNDATRMEMKSNGRYRTGGVSVSVPIVKGVRFRVGSGSIKGEKSWQATDNGRLLVTDKAVVFEGSAKNERITWTQVADIELLMDGFSISKRTGPPRTYEVTNPDPKFAAILDLMLSRTA